MALPDLLENALRSPEPYENLRTAAATYFAEGRTETAVYSLFEAARAQLRLEGREAEEDVVMEVMDCLVGWCSPHQELTPSNATPSANGPASPDESAEATSPLNRP